MANKNTRKVRRRRANLRRKEAEKQFFLYASKRQALITIGTLCTDEGGDEIVHCKHEGLTPLAMYSLKQVIEQYSDCELVPKLENGGYRAIFVGEQRQAMSPHKHWWEKDDSGLDNSLKFRKEGENCSKCQKKAGIRPYVNVHYDKYTNSFNKSFLEVYRDGAFSQLSVIKKYSGLDDQQWDYVLKHVAFSFTPNLEKSRSLVMIVDASQSNK